MTTTLYCFSNEYLWLRTAHNRRLAIILLDKQTYQTMFGYENLRKDTCSSLDYFSKQN